MPTVPTGEFILTLCQLDALDLVDVFLGGAVALDGQVPADREAIVHALGCLPAARAAERVVEMLARPPGAELPVMTAFLLALIRTAPDAARRYGPIASAIGDFLPLAPHADQRWRRSGVAEGVAPVPVEEIFRTLGGLGASERGLALAEAILARPASFPLDEIVVPVAVALRRLPAAGLESAAEALRAAALSHLRTRVALPLVPPSDWARASKLGCVCKECLEAARFLADPTRDVWVLAIREEGRHHARHVLGQAGAEVDTSELRTGSPYKLVVRKNRRIYDTRCKERVSDLERLEWLGG